MDSATFLILIIAVFATLATLIYLSSSKREKDDPDPDVIPGKPPVLDGTLIINTPSKDSGGTEEIYSFQNTAGQIRCACCDGENAPASTYCRICGEKLI